MTIKVNRLEHCRACGCNDFEMKLTLGALYPSTFLTEEEKDKFSESNFRKAPLTLVECKNCGLVQLQDTVKLDEMYKKYWYHSKLNKSMVRDLKDVYEKTIKKLKKSPTYLPPIHLDIGCNDGTLSIFFRHGGFLTTGFDPASNLKKEAEQQCDVFVNDYFTGDAYRKYVGDRGADVVTAIAMFYDLPNIGKFLDDIYSVMNEDGLFVVQLTDLYSMLKINAFDNICHEHLEYYTLGWLEEYFEKHGLVIFDAEYNKVNGGSLRVYACKETCNREISPRLIFYHLREALYFRTHQNWDDALIGKIIEIGNKIKNELTNYKKPFALGASTKGNTLLQVLHIDKDSMLGIGEVNEDKFNLYTVGTLIPIYPEWQIMNINPDICLVLPFHFEETFIKNLDGYLASGGKLLFPMPKPRVAYKENGKLKWKYL